jgi:hypothetical protein
MKKRASLLTVALAAILFQPAATQVFAVDPIPEKTPVDQKDAKGACPAPELSLRSSVCPEVCPLWPIDIVDYSEPIFLYYSEYHGESCYDIQTAYLQGYFADAPKSCNDDCVEYGRGVMASATSRPVSLGPYLGMASYVLENDDPLLHIPLKNNSGSIVYRDNTAVKSGPYYVKTPVPAGHPTSARNLYFVAHELVIKLPGWKGKTVYVAREVDPKTIIDISKYKDAATVEYLDRTGPVSVSPTHLARASMHSINAPTVLLMHKIYK